MKNNDKKRKHIIIVIGLVGMVVLWLLWGYFWFISPKRDTELVYEITYYDDYIPGSKYEFWVYSDRILMERTHFCSAIDCQATTDERTDLHYSQKSIDKLIGFIHNDFGDKRKWEINQRQLNDYQKSVMQAISLGENFFLLDVEDYVYRIEYQNDETNSYDIYLKKDNSVLVKKSNIDSDYNITSISDYYLNFSQVNMVVVTDYIKSLFTDLETKTVYKSAVAGLTKQDKAILSSVITNNEQLLKNAKNVAKLLYIVSYKGINCETPALYLYDDNTYEYCDYAVTGNKQIEPQTGKYNGDMTKIINSAAEKWDDDVWEYFEVKDYAKAKSYYVKVNDEMMNLFLDKLKIKLKKCLTFD